MKDTKSIVIGLLFIIFFPILLVLGIFMGVGKWLEKELNKKKNL